tara:strand:- start:979 stop:1854 length:876 start_codon:yes stop_codon:yes gene_type:complete
MESKSAKLSKVLEDTQAFVVAPGVFDMISAKLADRLGFTALYMTGSGTVASYLGLPDAGIATYTDMVSRARCIAQGISAPLIADADTGYGGPVNVRETIRGYEAAGVSAIQIEDQDFPKKCGHLTGHKLIAAEDMVTKIKVALDSRLSEDTLIIARTDARKAMGREEAMRRSEIYVKAGADVLFYEAPEDVQEIREVGKTFGSDIPLMANMVNGGLTPLMTPEQLKEFGFRIAIFPAAGFLAACKALEAVYKGLLETGDAESRGGDLFSFAEFNELMGFQEVIEFEEHYNL